MFQKLPNESESVESANNETEKADENLGGLFDIEND